MHESPSSKSGRHASRFQNHLQSALTGAWPGAMYATGSLVKCGRGTFPQISCWVFFDCSKCFLRTVVGFNSDGSTLQRPGLFWPCHLQQRHAPPSSSWRSRVAPTLTGSTRGAGTSAAAKAGNRMQKRRTSNCVLGSKTFQRHR